MCLFDQILKENITQGFIKLVAQSNRLYLSGNQKLTPWLPDRATDSFPLSLYIHDVAQPTLSCQAIWIRYWLSDGKTGFQNKYETL